MTRPPTIVVSANQTWNLVNFRGGLIRALLDRGFHVTAMAPPDENMQRQLDDMGCQFVPIAIDSAGLSPVRDARTFAAMLRWLRRERPAAWLSWTIKPNVYGSLAAALSGVPAFPNISGLGTAFIRRSLITMVVKRLYRTGLARAATVFFQNEDDRALFVAEGLVRMEQSALVPGSGVDLDHFAIPDSGRRPRARSFLMISRLLADKGVREFVEAARTVRQHFPDATFALLGAVDAENRTAVSSDEVASWVAEGVVTHTAPLADVRPAIAAADVIVLPSYREGLSRVLLEAAAMGRPSVATDVPGCRDIVRDGENGFLCPPRDAAGLVEALTRAACLDDQNWQLMSRAGRERVEKDFAQERVIGLYMAALEASGVRFPTLSASHL